MKKLYLIVLMVMSSIVSCQKFDASAIWEKLNEHEGRIEKLEALCRQINTNVDALQAIIQALQNNDYVTSVHPVTYDGVEVGYTIGFSKSEPITIYHGENGKDGEKGEAGEKGEDGATPVIGAKKDVDEKYYWTLNGEWLLDDAGNKIPATGEDGKDGEAGAAGANGQNGAEGITPKLEIRDGYWYVSYDNGVSYTKIGKATGEDGKNGDSTFTGVDPSDSMFVVFTLSDGTQIKLPTWHAFEQLQALCSQMNENITSFQTIVNALQDNDFVTGVEPVIENGKEIGYTISFTKSGDVTIYHGNDGADGLDAETPVIGIKKDVDDIYYWTLNGEWVLGEDGEKMNVCGKDGVDGSNGQPGAAGAAGANGVTPKFKIMSYSWYVSYDNGANWEYAGRATGYDGSDGIIPDVQDMGTFIILYLSDGSTINIPAAGNYIEFKDYIVEQICLENWDTDGDGRLSFEEAAAVEYIGDVFQYNDNIETFVEFQYFTGVTSLWGEFYHCDNLKTIVLPNTIENIGDSAFDYTNITAIHIPESVYYIIGNPFETCHNLEKFTGKFASSDSRALIIDSKIIAFAEAGLDYYTIPYEVTVVGDSAFGGVSLDFVEFSNNVVEIESYAFSNTILTSIVLPESLQIIGNHAFYQSRLNNIYFPASIQSFGDDVLYNCMYLSAIYGPLATDDNRCLILDGVLKCFAKSGISSYEFPEGIESIECDLLMNNYSLESLTLPSTLQRLKSGCMSATFSFDDIYCKAEVPPTATSPMYFRDLKNIYVPRESVDAYKASSTWSKYADYIKPYDF